MITFLLVHTWALRRSDRLETGQKFPSRASQVVQDCNIFYYSVNAYKMGKVAGFGEVTRVGVDSVNRKVRDGPAAKKPTENKICTRIPAGTRIKNHRIQLVLVANHS
jgi:hypothetical protein